MLRIRGTFGQWPVDLTIEMDAEDWQQLGQQLHMPAAAGPTAAPPAASAPATQDDAVWRAALQVLEQAGEIEGPDLLAQLEGLSGSTAAGKRLLVRLRHSPLVKMHSGADAPVYCWAG